MTPPSGKDDLRGRRLDVPSSSRGAGKRKKKMPADQSAAKRKASVGKSSPKKTGPKKKNAVKQSGSFFGRLIKWSVVAVIWTGIALAALVAWYSLDLPDIDSLSASTRSPSITFTDSQGGVLANYGSLYGPPVQVRDLPPSLIQALLATEDRRFYSHFGVDLIGLARAMWVNLSTGRVVQGGSTLTQQLAKNLFLSPERTLKRKTQEALLALWLEYRFSKDDLMSIYLNRVYLGAGTYGVEAASKKYFGKSAGQLGLYESALVAGLLKAPSRFAPTRNRELSDLRTRQVLANMVNAGYITRDQALGAEESRLPIRQEKAPPRSSRYFIDWLRPQIGGFIGAVDHDLVITTTLDPELQALAEEKLIASLGSSGSKYDVRQAALVTMSPDGLIRAMIGGRDYGDSQFNRVTQAARQPGSAFKMFVYLAALENGLSPDAVISDEPVTIGNWSPKNYSGKYAGPVTLRDGLSRSINMVAVKLSEATGREKVREVAKRLGLTANLPMGPSLALGTVEASLLEMTAAYAVLANGGYGVWAHGISQISDGNGQILYRRSGSGPPRAVSRGNVVRLNDMLGAVLSQGTGRAAQISRPAAGKTGTSQDFRDAWFIGYTADLVTGVWFGNDDNSPMSGVTGGGLPARLWRDFMATAHKNLPVRNLMTTYEPGMVFAPPPSLGVSEEEKVTPSLRPPTGAGFWDRLMGTIGVGN